MGCDSMCHEAVLGYMLGKQNCFVVFDRDGQANVEPIAPVCEELLFVISIAYMHSSLPHACVHAYVRELTLVRPYTCLCTCLYTHLYTCLYKCINVHTHVYTHAYTHVYTHVSTHVYTTFAREGRRKMSLCELFSTMHPRRLCVLQV